MNIYDFKVKDIKGEEIDMNIYRGKVLLIVNTATGCGFTPQYEGLQKLYEKYNEKGLEILDFPCNQFGNQASSSEESIALFCKSVYNISFKQFSKIEVNGKNEEPLYKYLKSQKGGILNKNIKWNFTKFLVNKEGKVIKRFSPITEAEKIESSIIELLK